MRISQYLGHLFFRISYSIYYKRKLRRTNTASLFGFSLRIPPGVFHPGLFFSTKILAKYLLSLDLEKSRLLEMGCGSGLLSLVAARKGAEVTGVDINPVAVECTRGNAEANGLGGGVRVIESNLFAELDSGEKFDYIVWNPPFYPDEPTDEASRAWKAGKDYSILREFAGHAPGHLHSSGKILLILTEKNVDMGRVVGFFEENRFLCTPKMKKRSFFESFSILEMTIK